MELGTLATIVTIATTIIGAVYNFGYKPLAERRKEQREEEAAEREARYNHDREMLRLAREQLASSNRSETKLDHVVQSLGTLAAVVTDVVADVNTVKGALQLPTRQRERVATTEAGR